MSQLTKIKKNRIHNEQLRMKIFLQIEVILLHILDEFLLKPFVLHDNNTRVTEKNNNNNRIIRFVKVFIFVTIPSVFQSSNSLNRSVRFLKIIRCRRVNFVKSNIY